MKVFVLLLVPFFLGYGNLSPPDKESIWNESSKGQVLWVIDTLPRPLPPGHPILISTRNPTPYFKVCPEAKTKEEKKKCSDSAIIQFIHNNLNYPKTARQSNVQGIAVVRFVVEKDGSLSNVKVLKAPSDDCGEEALRVIKQMPAWESPGMRGGYPVRVQYTLPVRFKL